MPHQKIAPRWVVGVLLCALLVMVAVPALSSPSQQANRQLIESDAAAVVREGTWESQVAAGASGSAYMYNTPSLNPSSSQWDGKPSTATLSLAFSGTTIEVWYVAGPGLGTLAIEVDGVVLRTVSTTSSKTAYQQKAVIDYLSNERHTLRVYAQAGGVVAIDAFIVDDSPMRENFTGRFSNDLTATAVSNSRIQLTWTDNLPDEIEFLLERSPNGTDNWLEIGRTPANSTNYINISLTCATTYYYRVRASLMGGGFSTYTNITTTTTLPCPGGCNPNVAVRRVAAPTVGSTPVTYEGRNPALSSDGRYVVFSTSAPLIIEDTNNREDIYLEDMQTCQVSLISIMTNGQEGTGDASYADISGDGRYIVFQYGGNGRLVSQDTNNFWDAYLHDRVTGVTSVISATPTGEIGNAESILPRISTDGHYAFFSTSATNLIPPYPRDIAYDLQTGQLFDARFAPMDVSGDGSRIVEVGHNYVDVMEWQANHSIQVYYTPNTGQNGVSGVSISANGRYVLFEGAGPDFDQIGQFTVYRYDLDTGERLRISAVTGQSEARSRSISSDGRYSLFLSNNPLNGEGDDVTLGGGLYLYDAQTNQRRIVNINAAGERSFGSTDFGVISDDGRFIAYESYASNLVPNDSNSTVNIYIVNLTLLSTRFQLIALPTSQTATQLTWTDNLVDESSWVVERSLNGRDQWSVIANLPADTTSYADSGLICSTRYYYRVRAYTANSTTYSTYSIVASAITNRCVVCDAQNSIHRVSVATGDFEGNRGSPTNSYELPSAISGDGRYVVFESEATNLVPNDTNNVADIFLHDRATCTTTRISQLSDGTQTNDRSEKPAITPDGRYIVFHSWATNLFANDTNNQPDVFLFDRQLGELSHVSPAPPGESFWGGYDADISADGRYVVYSLGHIYVFDRQTDITEQISGTSHWGESGGSEFYPTISDDGRYVAYQSYTDNLVPNDTNGRPDVFVYDRQTHQTQRVSVSSTGTQANDDSDFPRISGNGRFVVFQSRANNLVSNDTSGADVLVHDLQNHTTERVSINSAGQVYQVFAGYPDISGDGRYITFLADGIIVRDRQMSQSYEVSVSPMGAWGTGFWPRISNDGNFVTFGSGSPDLVTGDFNGAQDIFVANVHLTPQLMALSADNITRTQVTLNWTNHYTVASHYIVERYDNLVGWRPIATLPASQMSYVDLTLRCGFTYSYRVRAYWSLPQLYSTYSSPITVQMQSCLPDSLALFRTDYAAASLISSLTDLPPLAAYNSFNLNAPANGQFVMGDWNGDGLKTPGVYDNSGVFFYTNTLGPTTTWSAIWIGLLGRPVVAGRFNGGVGHDCIGAVDSANFPPYGKAFALYFTCDLTPATAPALTFQWLSVVLPDNQGYTGTHQFAAGDWNGDGVDSVAIRRGAFIAFTDIAPTTLLSQFNRAQYWGTPPVTGGNEGVFLAGNWNLDSTDSFGVFYANGNFYRRDDLDWNSGVYILQRVGQPIGTPVIATSWRQQ
ncbi:MAG: PD40 domain-containing protein [Chloroflexi bacterium]|nr:PD40 domain-containing protein [Chloroflexota bacterium]